MGVSNEKRTISIFLLNFNIYISNVMFVFFIYKFIKNTFYKFIKVAKINLFWEIVFILA